MQNKKRKNLIKSLLIICFYILITLIIWVTLKHFKLNDFSTLKEISNRSVSGQFVFLALQIIQVIFLPINSLIFTIPAIVILGPIKAFFISYIGVVIGSILIYYIGKFSGTKLLNLIIGKNKTIEYCNILNKGKFIFPILMIIPILPDDVLCASAGISNMKFKDFLLSILITRAIDLASTCFLWNFAMKNKIFIFITIFFSIIMYLYFYIKIKKQKKLPKCLSKIVIKK